MWNGIEHVWSLSLVLSIPARRTREIITNPNWTGSCRLSRTAPARTLLPCLSSCLRNLQHLSRRPRHRPSRLQMRALLSKAHSHNDPPQSLASRINPHHKPCQFGTELQISLLPCQLHESNHVPFKLLRIVECIRVVRFLQSLEDDEVGRGGQAARRAPRPSRSRTGSRRAAADGRG